MRCLFSELNNKNRQHKLKYEISRSVHRQRYIALKSQLRMQKEEICILYCFNSSEKKTHLYTPHSRKS